MKHKGYGYGKVPNTPSRHVPSSSTGVQIRSVKQYINEFIAGQDLSNGMTRSRIKLQILDHFRKELFGQLTMRYGDNILTVSRGEWGEMSGVRNILDQLVRKWRRLCMLVADAGIVGWLQVDDLQHVLDEDEEAEKAEPANLNESIDKPIDVVSEELLESEDTEEDAG